MTWRQAVRRAYEILRQQGIRVLWIKLLGELGYRRMLLVERLLDDHMAFPTPRRPVTVSLLRESEVDAYAAFYPGADPVETRRRLHAGHRCFTVRYRWAHPQDRPVRGSHGVGGRVREPSRATCSRPLAWCRSKSSKKSYGAFGCWQSAPRATIGIARAQLTAGMRAMIGDDIALDIEQLDVIAPEPGGKVRAVISHCRSREA